MDLVAQFIAQYQREFDFFEQAGRLVAQQLDAHLQASGVRAMVTSRAKHPRRLELKVRQRAVSKGYATLEDIYADIVDLAGVRVALYFPAEREEVDKIIRAHFTPIEQPKKFPDPDKPNSSCDKRFSGYWATHYRLHLRDSSLPEVSHRYTDARVEVQVASVLMHAWAEVEHDLVYKPLQGNLSDDELAILDELNGMVLAGEIALERLQRAAERRVKSKDGRFENHYDLASFLLEAVKPMLQDGATDPALGNVELLFQFLTQLELLTPEALNPYLLSLSPDTEQRPISQQITDQILTADPARYQIYAALRGELGSDISPFPKLVSDRQVPLNPTQDAFLFFMSQWIAFESFLNHLAELRGINSRIPLFKLLPSLDIFAQSELKIIDHIRQFRNQLVHGHGNQTAPGYLRAMGEMMKALLFQFANDERTDVRRAAQRALGIDGE